VNSRGNRLFTCRWTPKALEPRALIFICHGYGAECSISMGDTAARLVHSGFAVYGIDHEGHGKSSGSKGYISNFSAVVKDCSDHFKSVCEKRENKSKKRFLYGFSMGGTVVLQLHRKDPLYWDGAVLLAPMALCARSLSRLNSTTEITRISLHLMLPFNFFLSRQETNGLKPRTKIFHSSIDYRPFVLLFISVLDRLHFIVTHDIRSLTACVPTRSSSAH